MERPVASTTKTKANTETPPEIEIFRAGTHTSMKGDTLSFAESDLLTTAEVYDPALHEAPLVVGHPTHDAPAFGWVKGLSSDGASLLAQVDQIDPAFAEAVDAGRFKKVSASFYPPNGKGNPVPGTWYLRHVGFLGAQPPAVRGLKPIEFADSDADLVTVEFAMGDGSSWKRKLAWALRSLRHTIGKVRDQAIAEAGDVDAGNEVADSWSLRDLDDAAAALEEEDGPDFSETPEDTVTLQRNPRRRADGGESGAMTAADLEKRAAELAAREAAFAEEKAKADAVTFIQAKVSEGKVLPAQADNLVAFMASLDDEDEAVEFGEGDGKTPTRLSQRQAFQSFIDSLPALVEFAELAPPEGGDAQDVAFAAPDGMTVDQDALTLHRKALAYQKDHPGTDYITAYQAVGGR